MHRPVPELGVDLDARDELAVRQHDSRDARGVAPPALRPLAQRLERHAALPRDLDPALERLLGVGHGPRHVLVVRVHPELAAGRLDDRCREPVVVRVGVGADDQVDVAEPVPRLRERTLELLDRARLVDPGVDQHQSLARANRERVHVWNARPWQRKPQPPHAGQHAVGPPELASSVRLAHGGEATSAEAPISLILPP